MNFFCIAFCSVQVQVPVNVNWLFYFHIQILVSRICLFNKIHIFFPGRRMLIESTGSARYMAAFSQSVCSAHENILVEPVVSSIDKRRCHNGRGMWEMIRGGTGQHIPVLHISKNQVVHIGATLGSIFKAVGRGENVVVHNVRAMGNLP